MDLALPILGGLAAIIYGAELLVRGAVRLAESAGVSPLLIGLTIVGFGTSTPELVTSVQGALAGSPGIAVGNIVGSNIINVLVILALAAMIAPLAVPPGAIRRDGALVIVSAMALTLVGFFWSLDRLTGAVFLAALAAYLIFAAREERRPDGHTLAFDKGEALAGADPGLRPHAAAAPSGAAQWLVPLGLALGGLVLLVTGGRFFVGGSIELARIFGITEAVIGLTIVAAGTSMPELATTVLAALRRQADVAVGSILGSNIYNVLGIGGVTALISPTAVPAEIAAFDNLVMLAVCVVLLGMLYTGRRLDRIEGAALFAGYLVYVWFIWPEAGG
jgi:cation:H+ antiporter